MPPPPGPRSDGARLGWLLSRSLWPPEALEEESLPWTELLDWSLETGLFPLVRQGLRTLGIAPPEPVRLSLESAFLRNALVQSLYAKEMDDLLLLFRERGIGCVPFKGPALARQLYGSPSLRQSVDIDFFLSAEEFPEARELLRSLGYRSDLDEVPVDLLLQSHTECGFYRYDRSFGYGIELHWAFLWGESFEREALASLRREIVSTGIWTWEWLFLGLAANAARDGWRSAKLLRDGGEIALRKEFDPEAAREKARRFGWAKIYRRWEEALASHRELPPESLTRQPTRASFLALLPTVGRKAAFLRLLFFQPSAEDYQWRPLPRSCFPAYALLRPFRLLRSRRSGPPGEATD